MLGDASRVPGVTRALVRPRCPRAAVPRAARPPQRLGPGLARHHTAAPARGRVPEPGSISCHSQPRLSSSLGEASLQHLIIPGL